MISFQLPQLSTLAAFLDQEKLLDITYEHRGASAKSQKVPGFDNDFQRVNIGQGSAAFEQACAAIRNWSMFPPGWTIILPRHTPIRAGETVAMYAKAFGVWWRNSCRIIYVIEEPGRFGFAYGTLPGHIECGEELFMAEQDENGQVWYTIRAFSKPKRWYAKIAYPLMRGFQAQFRKDSAQAMKNYLLKATSRA
ncbi:MAG: DUF1990 domain-containing protein [Saprospiraceae bacterium]|nr:DUF1990 domain-containing protein [Saprospiraceae bacterium]